MKHEQKTKNLANCDFGSISTIIYGTARNEQGSHSVKRILAVTNKWSINGSIIHSTVIQPTGTDNIALGLCDSNCWDTVGVKDFIQETKTNNCEATII